MPTVFVIARDGILRTGVRAELREQGVEALGMETVDDAARALAAGSMPSAIVFEPGGRETPPAALDQLGLHVPVVVVASRMENATYPSTAAVLYRPVRIGEVVARVLKLLQGLPA